MVLFLWLGPPWFNWWFSLTLAGSVCRISKVCSSLFCHSDSFDLYVFTMMWHSLNVSINVFAVNENRGKMSDKLEIWPNLIFCFGEKAFNFVCGTAHLFYSVPMKINVQSPNVQTAFWIFTSELYALFAKKHITSFDIGSSWNWQIKWWMYQLNSHRPQCKYFLQKYTFPAN